jgi:tetratricopeptide (TPR) repeat protein
MTARVPGGVWSYVLRSPTCAGTVILIHVLLGGMTSCRPARPSERGEGRQVTKSAAEDLVLQGQVALRGFRLRDAGESFEHVVRLEPMRAEAYQGLIWVRTLEMREPEILAAFAALSELRALDFDLVLLWSQVRCGIWDPEKVVPRYRKFLDVNPSDRWVRLALAEGLRRLGEQDDALDILKALEDIDPEAAMIRARITLDRGDAAALEAILDSGLKEHPGLLGVRGQIALARNNPSIAIDYFRRSLSLRPHDRANLQGLAQALRLAGQSASLPPILETIHRLDTLNNLVRKAGELSSTGANTGLLHDLGSASEALEYLDLARAWFGLAIARDPTDSRSQAALFRLGSQDAWTRIDRNR